MALRFALVLVALCLTRTLASEETPEEKARREKFEGVDWSAEGAPDPDDWKQQHKNDIAHHEIDISGLTHQQIYTPEGDGPDPSDPTAGPRWRYKGSAQRLQQEIIPSGPVLHPGVQPNTIHPGDLAMTGADFEVEPPEPIPPQPPYLYPPQFAGEFDYNVPPAYKAFYPTTFPSAVPGGGGGGGGGGNKKDCVPVKDLPYIRALAPSKYQDDYCVPAKFLPYYNPNAPQGTTSQDGMSNVAENGYPSQTMQPLVSSPQFDLPMPFAHGPMFPAFHPPGPGEPSINPPPMVPLPAPANYNGNARRTPAMPMPPLPPAMWPYS